LSAGLHPTAPIPSNDVQPTDGQTPLVLHSLSYFNAVNGASLIQVSVTVTTKPAHGSATVDPATGDITYVAAAGFSGTDQLGFTVTDSNRLTSAPAFVNEVVSLPAANPDNIDTDAGNPMTIAVLANDSSAAAPLDPTTVAVVGGPSHGTASVDGKTGAITYTSVAGFSGTDTFSYTFKDTKGVTSNAALVSVVVNRPQANDDFARAQAGQAVVIGVLANDTDPDGPDKLDPGSVRIASGPSHGAVAVDPSTGAVTYTPQTGFTGTDSFTYTVRDVNNAVSNPATASIAVQQPTGGAVVNPVAMDTDAGNAVVIDVLAADSSPVGLNPATVSVQTAPGHGSTLVDPATGAITYTPAAGFAGTDTFNYSVRDNSGAVAGSAQVSVVVNRPKANDDSATTAAGQAVVIAVLANDTDPDGPNMLVASSVAVNSQPPNGVLTVDPSTGNVTYTPNAGFAGTDFFTYTVRDVNNAVSNVAMVNVVVTRPTANDAFKTTDSGFPITIDALANVSDPGGTLVPGSVTILSGPTNGTAVVDPQTGGITYTSIPGFNGTDAMTYTVADSNHAVSNVATITVVVNRPTAVADFATTVQNGPVTLNVAANDADPDGNQFLVPASVAVTARAGHGYVSVTGPGVFTYTPDFGFAGTDTFAYTIADAHGAVSNPATVTVTVTGPAAGPPSGPPLVFLPAQPRAPVPSGQNADTLFVEGLYRDVLGRQADPSGLSLWVSQLQLGATRAAVAQAFLKSAEHLAGVVTQYYQVFLNRTPDAAGLAGWVSAFEKGATEQQVAVGFVTSSEFLSQHNASDLLVNALYTVVLGRSADPAGLASWKALLDSRELSAAQVATAFLNSLEAQQAVVEAYYMAFLGRTSDRAGETHWLGTLQSDPAALDAVAAEFLASSEYASAVAVGRL
jgi:hypothetical protein